MELVDRFNIGNLCIEGSGTIFDIRTQICSQMGYRRINFILLLYRVSAENNAGSKRALTL